MSAPVVIFFLLAAIAVLGAVSLILQKHPIHSALSLIVVMVALLPEPGSADWKPEKPLFPVVPHFRMCTADPLALLSTKAIFFPSSDKTGEVRMRPFVWVEVL